MLVIYKSFYQPPDGFYRVEHYMTHAVCFHLQRCRGFEFKNGTFSSCAKCKQFNIHFPSSYFASSKEFIWILSVLYFLLIGSASFLAGKPKMCWLRFEQERNNKENWEINVMSGYGVLKTILIVSYSRRVGAAILIYAWEVFHGNTQQKLQIILSTRKHSLPYLQSPHLFLIWVVPYSLLAEISLSPGGDLCWIQ